MTAQNLYDSIIEKMTNLSATFELGRLHQAMLMECCENACTKENLEKHSEEVLMLAAVQALQVSDSMLKGLLSASLVHGDIINLNYRGETFRFDKESKYLIDTPKAN